MKKSLLSIALCLAIVVGMLFSLASCDPREFEGLRFEDARYMYDGQEHSIEVEGVPNGATIIYSSPNSQTEEGVYVITATVSAEGYITKTLTATLTIFYPNDYALDSDIEALVEMLNKAIADTNSATDAKLEALKTEYQAKIDALVAKTDTTNAEIDSLTTEYNAKVAELEATDAENATKLQALTDKYNQDLAILTKADEDNAEAIATLTTNFNDTVKALDNADKENAAKLQALTDKYNADLAILTKADEDNAEAIATLTTNFNNAVKALQDADAENETKLQTLTDKYNQDLETLTKADEDNAKAIEELTTNFNNAVKDLQDADTENASKLQALTNAYNEKVDELNGKIADNMAEIANVESELQNRIAALQSTHATEIANLSSLITILQNTDITTGERLDELEDKVAELLNRPIYTVTFDLNGGTGNIPSQKVIDGKKATKPQDPTNHNREFLGWYVGEEKWSFIGYSVTEDITLTAKWGDPPVSKGLVYTLSQGGAYYIVSGIGTCTDTDIVISSTYNGKPVKAIGSYAFRDCKNITSVTIPNGVAQIGNCAFIGCEKMKNVTIPDSVIDIASEVFDGCEQLNYTFYDNAYYLGNSNNPYVVLIEARTTIASANIHLNTKHIYYNAFEGCKNLTSVTIPDGVISGKD